MAAEVEIAESLPVLSFDPPVDTDAQATITDFVDYTELFPSDLIRSLTLIGKLDRTYQDAAKRVDELTTLFGSLPKLPHDQRPDAQALRKEISMALDHAIASREAAYAEATRISTVAERHHSRLKTIKMKLAAMPQPPSRDPTPAPNSPQAARSRRNDGYHTSRVGPHLDAEKERNAAVRPLKKSVLVPGDVLPAGAGVVYSAPESEPEHGHSEEDSDDDVVADAPDQPVRGGKLGRVKIPKAPKQPKTKIPKPARVRPPGVMGTNVHSAVAGISTSNALALLSPPPPEAKPGSKYRPWFKLTDWEMARLRKSMKKNAIWSPSDTMIRRELDKDGRGRENYEKAKALAEAGGEPLVDEDPIDPSKTELAPGEISFEQPKEANELVNRGMRLNEAKKHKKEKEMQELEEANRKIAAAGDAFKNLFSTPPSATVQQSSRVKKRKRDTDKDAPSVDRSAPPTPVQEGPKKIKLAPIAPKPVERRLAPKVTSPAKGPISGVSTVQVPLAPAGASSPVKPTISRRQVTPGAGATTAEPKKGPSSIQPVVQPTAAQSRSRRTSSGAKPITPVEVSSAAVSVPAKKEEPKELRPRSRGSMTARSVKAASAEPLAKRTEPRELRELRRASVVDGHPASEPSPSTAMPGRTTRGGRRPAPGVVTGVDEDGKGKVSVGKRRAAPKKTVKPASGKKEEKKDASEPDDMYEPDDVDPDEPRYCLCNGVSWGTMIACENEHCAKEWFHLPCVGLEDIPPRRAKWYCPECER